jgi:hypothetical protein
MCYCPVIAEIVIEMHGNLLNSPGQLADGVTGV